MIDSAFWQFSLRFYALPDVAPACLKLQDDGGADVNLLLFLLFLAQARKCVSAGDIGRLDRAVALWREEAVKPLRALRRRLKEGIGAIPPAESAILRNQIKKVELEAERLEQAWLEREANGMTLTQAPSRADAAHANLHAYGEYAGKLPGEPLKILLAAFTDSPP